MLILTTSPAALMKAGNPDASIVQAIIRITKMGNLVGVISNHEKPDWFDATFAGSNVRFIKTDARQTGEVIRKIADDCKVNTYDILVLAVKSVDLQMAKNGRAVLVAAGWSTDKAITGLGLKVDSPAELEELTLLTNGWHGKWWFEGQSATYSVRALVDLSTLHKGFTQQQFARSLTNAVKRGGARLAALLTVTARSLLMNNIDKAPDLVWGVYPSSSNTNASDEVLTDFTHRLRTTASRFRWAKIGEPLFIRHTASAKRSAGQANDRTDPLGQIITMHLNPYYKGKLGGRNIIVIDDCTTYGVSFAVAAALLRKAGANSVHGIAIGKFGSRLSHYDIAISTDPFQPIPANGYVVRSCTPFAGTTDGTAQASLEKLINET